MSTPQRAPTRPRSQLPRRPSDGIRIAPAAQRRRAVPESNGTPGTSKARRRVVIGQAAVDPRLPAAVAGVGVAFFVVQAALGWGLGVAGAGITVLIAVSLLAVLVVTDALDGSQAPATDDRYDVLVCAVVTLAVAIAIACLYLPLPWGGLAAATVLAVLVVAMRLL